MFRYNPTKLTDWEAHPNGTKWRVVIDKDQKKFVVTYMPRINMQYIVDGFENRTGCRFNDEDNIWYSFDSDRCNFHIVPGKEVRFEDGAGEYVSVWLKNKLERIRDEVDKIKEKQKPEAKVGGVKLDEGICKRYEYKCNHKYFCVDIGQTQYLMSFNRLWCDVKANGTHICNNFGQAQFMCFPKENKEKKEDGQINLFHGEFELMYPSSDRDGEYNSKAGHLAYNAPYSINDYVEVIAKGFVEFIELCEIMKNEKNI